MTLTNAIKKMNKYGEVKKVQNYYTITLNSNIIEITQNGRDDLVSTIRVRRAHDIDDPMSDYCAGSFFDNLTQALRFCEGR